MARNKQGWTPLHFAARFNDSPAVVEEFVSTGLFIQDISIDARDSDGYTPLQYAARYSKSADIVKSFLRAGANPTGSIFTNNKPVDLIQENENLRDGDLYWDLLNKSF